MTFLSSHWLNFSFLPRAIPSRSFIKKLKKFLRVGSAPEGGSISLLAQLKRAAAKMKTTTRKSGHDTTDPVKLTQ
jgi:hypothetical protein